MRKVLDAYALLAFLEKEAGYQAVQRDLKKAAEGKLALSITVVNLGEVYYIIKREFGQSKADQIIKLFSNTFPVEVVEVDWDLVLIAARFKANHRISYADCFAAALAKKQSAVLITGDPEFRALVKEIKVEWL